METFELSALEIEEKEFLAFVIVSIENGEVSTAEDSNRWWHELRKNWDMDRLIVAFGGEV